jgi:DNA-binding beta-propeller fold protein YncE
VTELVTGQDDPSGIAVNGSNIYWADLGSGTIMEANLDGSSPQAIVSGQPEPAGIAVDGSNIYWANYAGDAIFEANLDGTGAQQVASGQFPWGVAVGPQ